MRVLATAGHVDHGKSALVRALTGMEPDRWAEERRRGMTIDLGYAWMTLPSGTELAFVDVPGHQRFIANMLAGLGPAPTVLFVVAADEGWSRQSEEHLHALTALQVTRGLLVVTRSDLADPAPALAQSRERIARSSLGNLPSLAVSSVTGAGLEELVSALDRLVGDLPEPDRDARVRLWVDRSFTVRGSGTVVTGTLSAGRIAVGDELELNGERVGVRGLQSLGQNHRLVEAEARIAVNLRGVDRGQVSRGDALLTPGAWHLASVVDVRLDTEDDRPEELMLHVGAAGVAVRVRPLAPGLARLTLPRPLPLSAGDRAVLRDPGQQSVAAGVVILDADPPALARRGAAARRGQELQSMSHTPDLEVEVRRRGAVRVDALRRLGVPLGGVEQCVQVGDWLVDPATWAGWRDELPTVVQSWSARYPLEPGMPTAVLVQSLLLPAAELLGPLIAETELTVSDGRVGSGRPTPSLGAAEPSLRELERRLGQTPFAAPDRSDLDTLGLGRRELAVAERAGRLVRIGPDLVLLPSAPTIARQLLAKISQPFTLSEARIALGTTRRVAVPLLEYLDAHGLTRRVDEQRRAVTP